MSVALIAVSKPLMYIVAASDTLSVSESRVVSYVFSQNNNLEETLFSDDCPFILVIYKILFVECLFFII